MKHLRLLASIAAALIIVSMALSMLERSIASIICFVLAFFPLGAYCHILDKQERETDNN